MALSRKAKPNYLDAATADNTKLAYHKDLQRFVTWGGDIPSSPDQVAAYISAHGASHKASTLARWVASISQAHKVAGFDNPCGNIDVRRTLRGIRSAHGAKQRHVAPAVRDELIAMVTQLPPGLVGTRDKALLLVGFAGALRRSELAKLEVKDIHIDARGMILPLGKTKTDQAGESDEIAIPFAKGKYCPVRALQAWLKAGKITGGPIFRRIRKNGLVGPTGLVGFSIAQIVKASVARAGLDPALYSGHSLRAGLATSSAKEHKPFHKIKAQTRHKSDATLLRYIRDAELFEDNAADFL
jgi:integrase